MEQERYRWLSPFDDKVLDDKTNNIINAIETLNQQDKKVKKLEQENQQLKQQLHDLPKNIVGEIRDVAGDYWDFNMCEECGNVPDLNTLTTKDFDEILDTILEKYGGVEK